MLHLALYQPEIPQNVGTLMRLCACFQVTLHIIEPIGFLWDDKRLKRSQMDYMPVLQRHLSWERFHPPGRLLLVDTKGQTCCWDMRFQDNDVLLLGQESMGVPSFVKDQCDHALFIPMERGCRSLNVAIAGAMVLGEAKRQLRIATPICLA